MTDIDLLADEEAGLSCREKINESITEVNKQAPVLREVVFEATENDDDLQLSFIDAKGYNSISINQISFKTGASVTGVASACYNLIIDGEDASGGTVAGYFVSSIHNDGLDGVAAHPLLRQSIGVT